MKILAFLNLILILLSFDSVSQTYTWKLVNSFDHENIEAWDVTPLEELIISEQSSIYMLDKDFKVAFIQSRKGFGSISKIDARHSLKTLTFSEDQQMIGFVDNTLTFQEGKIDLARLNIGYGTHVCYSDQTSRFWVFDEQNARLLRFEGIKSSVAQSEISNLMAITYNDMPTSMIESQNQLFLFYQGSAVFVFDFYGSLIRKYDNKNSIQVYPTDKYLYILQENTILRIDRKSNQEEIISLPKTGIEDFRVFGSAVYFKDKKGVSKYSLIPNK